MKHCTKLTLGKVAAALLCALGVNARLAAERPFPEFSSARALTSGPKEHFFANYFAINAWSPDNRYVLVLETDIKAHLPDGVPCTLGLVDTEDGNKFIPVTTTRCWNFQEATMAHWMPCEKDTFVFNDMRDGKFVAVVMNWKTKKERIVPCPVSAVSEDGTWALGINYARLYLTRPDYGYAGEGQNPRRGVVFPKDDGLFKIDLKTGKVKLIVSCADVKSLVPEVKSTNGMSYICHTVISKDMKRVYFLSRSVEMSMEGEKTFKGVKWQTTAFTCNADGTGIRRCFPDGWGSSHFNWKPALSERDARTMTVTCKWQNRVYTHVEFTVGEEHRASQIGGREMDFDGHCIYTPDGEFVSGDGYIDKRGYRHWKMVRLSDDAVKDLGEWFVPEIYREVYSRCDLHPRWRPDGMQLGFNSVHEGSRQVYVLDVVKNPPVPRPALLPMPRKVEWKGGWCPKGAPVTKTIDKSIPAHGYRLEISPKGVAIASSDDAGAFYAEKTLQQFGDAPYPCCAIEDSPKSRWRGVLVDEGRHFFGKGEVKRLLDVMADYKYNVFHWHLTEDQGWRLAIDKWPRLAEVGSVRRSSPPPGAEKGFDNERYGPYFYTKDEVREIVAYARARHIEVVPEIDFPGHVLSVLAAYPELSCRGDIAETGTQWGVFEDVLCAGNDKTMQFLKDVMDEVCDMFPAKVVHLGGDEAPRTRWNECPKCQKRMKELGFRDANELQKWMFREVQRHLAAKGRKAMGWEVKYGGADLGVVAEFGDTALPKGAIVQSWRTVKSGVDLVTNGYEVVMSPCMETYYTLPIGLGALDPFPYRLWTKKAKPLDLRRSYFYSPFKNIPREFEHRVLGGEVCAWTESTHNRAELEWKMFPRALAHAEALWSDPQPRDFECFAKRAAAHRLRLLSLGINCSPLVPDR